MGKTNPKNWEKTVTLEKWLIVTLNWSYYRHPPINPTQSNIARMSWTTISHPPWIITPNWCGLKCFTRISLN
jgi:hypothetical protein